MRRARIVPGFVNGVGPGGAASQAPGGGEGGGGVGWGGRGCHHKEVLLLCWAVTGSLAGCDTAALSPAPREAR